MNWKRMKSWTMIEARVRCKTDGWLVVLGEEDVEV